MFKGGPRTGSRQPMGGRRRASAVAGATLAILGAAVPSLAAPGYITTIAGGGIADGPSGGPSVVSSGGIAFDSSGSLVFSDMLGQRVRKVGSGKATTIAGSGSEGFGGDGGPALKALFDHPHGIAIDAGGNVLIADNENNRVRKLSPDGILTTVAGNGKPLPGVVIGDLATEADLYRPYDVELAPDGGFFVAHANHIRRVDNQGRIATYAGVGLGGYDGITGDARLSRISTPFAIASSSSGDLFFADQSTHVVRRISPSGIVSTIAGTGTAGFSGDGGPATNAQLSGPSGVAVTSSGEVLIADMRNQRIRKVSPEGTITTLAGNGSAGSTGDGGPAASASVYYPRHVAIAPTGAIYFAEADRIRMIDGDGTITTPVQKSFSFGGGFSGDGGPGTEARFRWTYDVIEGPDGSVYISDFANHRVRRLDQAGIVTTVAGNGQFNSLGDGGPATSAGLYTPTGLALDETRRVLYVAQSSANRVRAIDLDTGIISTYAGTGIAGHSGDGGPATAAQLQSPRGIAVGGDGSLFVAVTGAHRVRKIGPDRVITTVAGTGIRGFGGDGGSAESASFDSPSDVALGSDGSIYIADSHNNAVRRIDHDGIVTTIAGRGDVKGQSCGGYDEIPATMTELSQPSGVAIGPDGLVYIADTGNSRIRQIEPDGFIMTVAGRSCSWTFDGDGGPADLAALHSPWSIAFDSDGGMLIADSGNDRVRYVEGPIP